MDRRKKDSVFNKKTFPLKNTIALTTGDPAGIGSTVAFQALKALGPKKNFQFMLWTCAQEKTFRLPRFKTFVFQNSQQALKMPFKENHLLQIKNSTGPAEQLEEATKLCLAKKASALVTGPVSKTLMKKNKRKALSQTALLKILCKKKNLFMCFRGKHFNTILLTDHIPLKNVEINKKTLRELLILSLQARDFLPTNKRKKAVGLLALNPHSGESGLIGKEEQKILWPIIKEFSSKEVQGPLCPDAAFLKKNWGVYSFFIALYHDQGLIPFKMAHSHKGFAQTLGLPFLRLGVDHGTGLGLKQKEISSESFLAACKEALRLVRLNVSDKV